MRSVRGYPSEVGIAFLCDLHKIINKIIWESMFYKYDGQL